MRKKKDKPKKQIRTVPLQVGELTTQKREILGQLRADLLTHAQAVAALLFVPDPLADTTNAKEKFALLSDYQKQQSGINKAYLQVMVQQVQQAAFEQERRYFARFFGRLRNVNSEIPKAEQKERIYYYVPVDVQGHVTETDFAKLSALAELEFVAARTLLREVLIENDPKDFTLIQRAILQEIHEQALRRHRQLTFKDTEETAISIPLDYRMLPQTEEGAKLLGDLSGEVQLLLDRKNTQYQFFLSLSAPTPRADRIKLPVTISARVLERLLKADEADVNSLTLVLGHNKVSVRMALGKPHTEPHAAGDYFVARDFGYVNTISLSVVRLDEQLDAEKLADIQAFTKEQAKKFLTSHALPEGESQIVERVRFSGRKFLDKISEHCQTIDGLRSWIDTSYNKLEALKKEIVTELNLPEDALLSEDSTHSKTRKFFQLLAKINKWKARRRSVYKKIAGLKKSWFGYLSNQELALAKKYNATLVRENLTVKAIEVDDPKYKGRLFNKMLNNGAQGQYRRAASEKFLWYGVPEVTLPSFFTSQVCTVHALIDETVRQGERFKCPKCPAPRHADEHAADTIGLYLLLKPFVTNTLLSRSSGL